MTQPSVWAIVLMYGGEEITAACIDSLLAQDYAALTVLLVDNASPDGSGQRLRARYPRIEFLNTGANLGYTGGNNRGIEHAVARGGDYVLVLNNDTVLERDCVSRLVDTAIREDRVGVVSPKILYFDDPTRIWYAGGDYSRVKALGRHRRELEVDTPDEGGRVERMTFASGCAFLMPAGVAREMGGFSEDFFMYCEDVELGLRLAEAGYHLYYQPAARVYHREPPRAPNPTAFQIRLRDRNRRRLVRKHYGLAERLMFAGWFYPTRMIRLSQYALRRDWKRARAIVAGALEA